MLPERRAHQRRWVNRPHAIDVLSPLGPLLCHTVAEVVSPLTDADLAALAGPEPQAVPAGRACPCPAGARELEANPAPNEAGPPSGPTARGST